MADKTPASPSGEWLAGSESRQLIADIAGGLPAIQRGGERYLTRWKDEDEEVYRLRLKDATWTPLFDDLLDGIASKPFTKEVGFKNTPPDRFKAWAEDIDGEGNSQHVFARTLFRQGIRDGVAWILVDYPAGEAPRTQAEEARSGRRPYFVKIDEADLIAVYCERIGGKDVIVHARFMEREVKRAGWDEEVIERVRVLERGAWYLFRKTKDANSGKIVWVLEDQGTTSIDFVPLVPFRTSRDGPPLIKIARLQIELYRRENNLKSIENRTAFPIYAANKMTPEDSGEVVIGPGAILYGGNDGEWDLIEPAGTSMEQIRVSIADIKTDLRRLGLQPLLPGSGDITATATSVEAVKAHSLVQNWALDFADAMEQAWKMAGQWVGEAYEPEIFVNTDFGIELADIAGDQTLLMMHEQRVISREALIEEMKRRGRLTVDYNAAADKELIDKAMDDYIDLLPEITAAGTPPSDGSESGPDGVGTRVQNRAGIRQPKPGTMGV